MSALSRRQQTTPFALEALVASPDPNALTITLDVFDGDQPGARHEWEVVWWAPLPDAVPRRGDRCLAILSDRGRVWVLAGAWTGRP